LCAHIFTSKLIKRSLKMFSKKRSRSSRSSSASSMSRTIENEDDISAFPEPVEAIIIDAENPENLDENDVDADLAGGSLPPELSEDTEQNPGIQRKFTQNHPLGKILLDLVSDTYELSKKTKRSGMDVNIEDLCRNFYNAVRLDRVQVTRAVQKANMEFENQLIEKEMNSHLLNDNTNPPKYYSPIPTLLTSGDRNEALKTFPTQKPRFSGQPTKDNMDIIEFLSAMRTAQEYCKLSEKEFKQFLLLCTTGRAHTLLMEWINLEETVPTLFHSLLMHFDKRLTPEAAKAMLFTYKAPKNLPLNEVETNIMLWVSRAASVLPAGPSRTAYYNMEVIQTLIRCLPPFSSAKVQSVFNTLSARLGRAARAVELSRALNIERHAIDNDIRQNGIDRNQNNRSMQKKMRRVTSYAVAIPVQSPVTKAVRIQNTPPKRLNYRSSSRVTKTRVYNNNAAPMHTNRSQPRVFNTRNPHRINGSNNQPRAGANQNGNRNTNNRYSQGFRRPPNRNNSDKNHRSRSQPQNYCSLCGRKDHLASQGCPHMVSDQGVTIGVMPCHSTCKLCPPSVRPRLNHPSTLCPYRKGGPFANQSQ